jgi:hypothetical protein
MSDKLQIPPIRTRLDEGTGQPAGRNAATAKTAKEWYLYWQRQGELANEHTDAIAALGAELSGLIRKGTHAERLAAAPDPIDGLWLETDRGNVVYQAQVVAGIAVWVYLTGTMRGLLAGRPADLGPNDAGFLYSATDALDYRWSGAVWEALDTVRGGADLSTVGAIPKVSAAGALNESALLDDGTAIRLSRTISGTVQPTFEIDSGIAAKGRIGRVNNMARLDLSVNLSFDGTNFNLDDTTLAAKRITMTTAGVFFQDAPAGAGPAAIANRFVVIPTGVSVDGVYSVAGTQVVGPRGAALTASGLAVAAPPAAYNPAYETTVGNLANNLKVRLDELELRLKAHGLIA